MMDMKKLKCKICECEFVPEKKEHYVARTDGKTGVVSMFKSNDETGLFDAFDCPQCGCQVIAQERKRTLYMGENMKVEEEEPEEDEEETEEPIPARAPKRRVPEREE